MGYSALYTITPESFPTEIRNLGSGSANICARVGGVICPIITGIMLSQPNGFEVAISVYAILFFTCGSIAFILRETKNKEKHDSLI